MPYDAYSELAITIDAYIAQVRWNRGPNNFFDAALIIQLADAFAELDKDPLCRVIVIGGDGKNFCAGADFGLDGSSANANAIDQIYGNAVRLFAVSKPVIAAVQGAAVGGGLGLALVADFRVTCDEARFTANFCRLGIHPGFGLSKTLPALIGTTQAAMMFFTGRRYSGTQAVQMGLANVLVAQDAVWSAAIDLAREIALSAPAAVRDTRASIRGDMAAMVAAATQHEMAHQQRHVLMEDFKEGVKAMRERRPPEFRGK
jgi:enoyl-CoA hydratase/carnithine racemase